LDRSNSSVFQGMQHVYPQCWAAQYPSPALLFSQSNFPTQLKWQRKQICCAVKREINIHWVRNNKERVYRTRQAKRYDEIIATGPAIKMFYYRSHIERRHALRMAVVLMQAEAASHVLSSSTEKQFLKKKNICVRDTNLRAAAQNASQIMMEIRPRTKKHFSATKFSVRGKLRKTRRKREYKDPPLSCVCAAGVP